MCKSKEYRISTNVIHSSYGVSSNNAIFAKDMPQMKQVKFVGICSKYEFLSLRSP